jgi:sialate O-acetylesterase
MKTSRGSLAFPLAVFGGVMWCALLVGGAARADVQLPAVFSDHMVLQRDLDVPIWGTCEPNATITVRFREQTCTTTADDQGRWLLRLEPLEAGGPDPLIIEGSSTITLEDVLVGDVWVGSGQSNMAGNVAGYAKNDPVLAELAEGTYPGLRLCRGDGGGWRVADAASIPRFSALLFAFGQQLRAELEVPIGLIAGTVGGTPSGRWMTQPMLDADEASQRALQLAAENYSPQRQQAIYQRAVEAWEKAAATARQESKPEPKKPAPPVEVGQIRSERIGDLYEKHILPIVPFGIRGVLWDQGESGTAIEGLDQFHATGALIRGWRQAWGQGDFPFLYVQKPSGGGCAWNPKDPVTREAEPFAPLPPEPLQGNEGGYRELHCRIKQHPATAMVTARDLGSGVHPINKSGYGRRAAQVALGFEYLQPVPIYGPLYESHTIEGNRVRVKFRHVGKGLAWKHGEGLQGFSIAGPDCVFHWASAEIDGDTVLVCSDRVDQPVAVRYAWAASSPWANLFNLDGLPALVFRTDDW